MIRNDLLDITIVRIYLSIYYFTENKNIRINKNGITAIVKNLLKQR